MYMNKKTISILIFLSTLTLVVNCSIITIFADNYDDTSEIKNIYDSTEIGEVFQTIENDALINNSTATYENSEQKINNEELSPYKIYSISPQEFSDINIDYVVKNKIKSDDYKWIVPDNNKRVIKVGKKQGKWEVLGYSTFENNTEGAEILLSKSVNNILTTTHESVLTNSVDGIKNNNLSETYICFEIPQYHTYFVGLFSDNESYVIPYGSRPDLTGLENGKKYSIENANKILTVNFGITESNYDNGGGISNKTNNKIQSAFNDFLNKVSLSNLSLTAILNTGNLIIILFFISFSNSSI